MRTLRSETGEGADVEEEEATRRETRPSTCLASTGKDADEDDDVDVDGVDDGIDPPSSPSPPPSLNVQLASIASWSSPTRTSTLVSGPESIESVAPGSTWKRSAGG